MMRFTRITLSLAMLIAFAAISQAQDDTETETKIPGTIAYIGLDLNTYTIDPTTEEITQLTDDAMLSDDAYRYYRWPTWSTDGRLAYFAVSDATDEPYATEIYVSKDGNVPGERIYTGQRQVFNYASWAPANCGDTSNCRILAVLMNASSGGLFVEAIKDQVEGNPTETIGRGGPFYYSWSSDAQGMVWQRNNRSLDVYGVEDSNLQEQLSQRPGMFQAPHWSPVDNRLLLGTANVETQTTDIAVITDGESDILVPDLEGVVAFAWSPSSDYVAYVDDRGPLMVVDSTTGETISRTINGGVVAFFWSPDDRKLAYITLAVPPGAATASSGLAAAQTQPDLSFAWSVLDVDSGEVSRYEAFTPTRESVYMFTYFDQFAQSHRVWSPDGRYLIYGASTSDGPAIQILDTEAEDAIPRSLVDGTLPIWSFK